jgi:hypothetical protein
MGIAFDEPARKAYLTLAGGSGSLLPICEGNSIV